MHYQISQEAIDYLKSKDEKLAKVIDYIGDIEATLEPDIFSALCYHILGQQVSVIVQDLVYDRLKEITDGITPEKVLELGVEKLKSLGMTYRKAETIYTIAQSIVNEELDLEELRELSDEEILKKLTKFKGIGPWTAEMLLMFTLERPDVFTFGDVALKRGLKMIYHLDDVDKKQFEHFKELFSPYGTVASIYIWAVGEYKVDGISEFVLSLGEGIEG